MYNDSEFKIQFGSRVKELRNKRKLTQEKLAEMIGVGERNMSKIECGKNFVTAETLSKLLVALDVEPEELFHFNPKKDIKQIKKELIKAIEQETTDVELIYQFYKTIR